MPRSKRPDTRGHLQKRNQRNGPGKAARARYAKIVAAADFRGLFDGLNQEQRKRLERYVREQLLSLPTLELILNAPPPPAARIQELEDTTQRLIDASVFLRASVPEQTAAMLERMIDAMRAETALLREPGRLERGWKHRGLQVLACRLMRHMRHEYFPDLDEAGLQTLVLDILDRADRGLPDRRASNVRKLFAPPPYL